MDNNVHNGIYTAEDIQNYLSGRLSPLQMHAMEKAALEDPFLAEAMEGYDMTEEKDLEKQLAGLRETFAQKQQGAKIIPLTKKKNNWWKAAAAVFILGGTATLAYFLLNDKKPGTEIAQSTVTKPVTAAADSVTVNPAADMDALAKTATVPAAPVKENKTIIKDITRNPQEQQASGDFVYKPAPQATAPVHAVAESKVADDEVAKNTTPPAAPITVNTQPQEAVTSNNAPGGYNRNNAAEYDFAKKKAEVSQTAGRSSGILNKTFYAQVMSPDNSPLPFANISNKAENFGTYADVKGNFRLLSNDSVLTVEIRSAGFRPQVVTLRSNVQQNRIILTEEVASSAQTTVISGNGDAKSRISRRAVLVKDSVLNVEPADGWDNYITYATNNIDIPDDILKSNIHGQVEISFEVNANGAITNIKVDKSLCDNCDEAAIRMLQQGPQWKIKKGKKGKGKIRVQF